MKSEDLSTLQIHALSNAQFERDSANGSLRPNELYLTPVQKDTTPAEGSDKPITSGAVYEALKNVTGKVESVNGKTGIVTLTASDVGALPENTVIPTVPTKVSAFENDKGYLTQHQSLENYALKTDLDSKQNTLTFDDEPIINSTNAITSGAVYDAIQNISIEGPGGTGGTLVQLITWEEND